MEIKRTKLLRLIGKKMITLPWGVYAAPKALVREKDVVHEFIHIAQWKELWYVGFALLYLLEWAIRKIYYLVSWLYRFAKGRFKKIPYIRKHAYKNISFEREAYENDDNLQYLEDRPRYNWIEYL